MSGGEWISRNPSLSSRKRDRRSYDNSWSTYEARGNGNGRSSSGGGGGGIERFQGGAGGGRIDRNNITAQGERVGIPHNEIPRVRMVTETAPAGPYGQGGVASGQGGSNYNNNPYGGGSSRVRVADYRGSAARVGQLPARDGPHPSIYQADSSYRGGGGGNNSGSNNNYNIPLFSNPEFLASLKNPPPITVTLPKDLRSTLNDEQTKVVESVLSGHSTFFTGPAGSGKSHVLSTLLKANKAGIGGKNGKQRKIIVTATTGVAACNVGGVTIHTFSGVGAESGSLAELAKRVMGNEYSKDRWREVDILVIDEISMMAGSFLDKLSFVASRARNDRRPFGGVQLVVCGDFFQLPPIDLNKHGFAFESKCWPQVIKCSVLLKQVFRQRGDTTLMDILNEARIGELSQRSVEVLRRHGTLPSAAFGSSKFDDSEKEKIIPTLLECRNREVDKANEREMNKLEGEIVTFTSRDRAVSDGHQNQLKHCAAPQVLKLKVGAQVMLLKNLDLDKGLANGSRGVVVRFQRPKSQADVHSAFKNMDFPVVKFDAVKAVGKTEDDESESTEVENEFVISPEDWSNKLGDQTVSSRIQIPLRPFWSISVHKSQGMTIPNLTVNLAGVFEYGQAYVALSRATELKLLTLRGFSEKSFRAHPKVKAFYRVLDGKPPNVDTNKRHINKENVVSRPIDHIGELPDPFEAGNPRQGNNPYISGSNPYAQRKKQPGYSSNPYQQQRTHQANGRFSPMPQTSPRPPQMASASPTLTQDQKQRMEENRNRAFAIRMKKQSSS